MRRNAAWGIALASLAYATAALGQVAPEGAAPGLPASRGKTLPSILLVSLDTLGARHLGTYGYARATSPVIDALAKEGAVFEHAMAPAPSTPPSHATLFTSTLGCVHGLDGTSRDRGLPDELATLAEVLRKAGWATGAFTENAWVTAALGFDRGFDVFVENTSPKLNAPTGQAEKTFADALEWIRDRAARPWFAFVHTYQVHHPYAPPDGLVAEVAPDHAHDRNEVDRAKYDAEIRYTDRLLGELLSGVEEAMAGRPLLLVVLSDHGELFGEHGQVKHGFSLYQELLHVPLIFHAPGWVESRRISDRVGLIDVTPTILELLGLPPLPRAQGQSLAPLLRGETLPAERIWAELGVLDRIATYAGSEKRILDLKARSGRIFDLANDPNERSPEHRPTLGEASLALVAEYERLCADAPAAARTGLRPEVHRKLEALGYVQ